MTLDDKIQAELLNYAHKYENFRGMSREFINNADPDILKNYSMILANGNEQVAGQLYQATLGTPGHAIVDAMRNSSAGNYKSLGDFVKSNYDALVDNSDEGTLVRMARGLAGKYIADEKIDEAMKDKDGNVLREAFQGVFKGDKDMLNFINVLGSFDSLSLLVPIYQVLEQQEFLNNYQTEDGKGLDANKLRTYLKDKKDDKMYSEVGRGYFMAYQAKAAEKAKKEAEEKKKPKK